MVQLVHDKGVSFGPWAFVGEGVGGCIADVEGEEAEL